MSQAFADGLQPERHAFDWENQGGIMAQLSTCKSCSAGGLSVWRSQYLNDPMTNSCTSLQRP